MNRFFKTFLLWLLIATLPMQGMAAAMKMSCAPDHGMDHVIIQAIEGHESPHSAMHANSAENVHHAHQHESADLKQAAKSMDAKDSASHAKAKHMSCSACAACCTGAVIPPSASIHTPESSLSDNILISPASWVAGYIPPSLERPPRRLLI